MSGHLIVDGIFYDEEKIRSLVHKVETKSKQIKTLQDNLRYWKERNASLGVALQPENRGEKRSRECFQMCSRSESDGRVTAYEDLKPDHQKTIRTTITKFACAGSTDKKKTMAVVLDDLMAAGRKTEVRNKVQKLLENSKVAQAIQFKVRATKQRRIKEEDYAALRFVDRKLEGIGRERDNKFRHSKRDSESFKTSELQSSPLTKKLSSWDDQKAHKFFKKVVPNLPQPRVNPAKKSQLQQDSVISVEFGPDGIDAEHASVNPVKLLGGILTTCYVQAELHPNFVWMWDPEKECYRVNHTEWGCCLDGFPIHGFSDGAAMQSIQLYNLPGLVHSPQFVFPQALYVEQENSPTAWVFLRELDEAITQLDQHGFDLVLDGFDENMTLPHSTIKLNGKHHITCGFNLKGDLKARLQYFGSISACLMYNSPDFKFSSEAQMRPENKCTAETFVPLEERVSDFDAVKLFCEQQQKKFKAKEAEINKDFKNRKFSEKQRLTKLINARKTILVTEVNQYAASKLKTCCIHQRPLSRAMVFGVCSLHLSTNEFLRFVNRMESLLCRWALEDGCPTSSRQIKKSAFENIPNLNSTKANKTGLALFIGKLKNIGLPKLSMTLLTKYTGEDDDTFNSGDGFKSSKKVTQTRFKTRLIGENVNSLSTGMPEILECVPISGHQGQRKQDAVIMHAYGHILKCMTAISSLYLMQLQYDEFGARLVGDLFGLLVFRFCLHESLNTFYFSKVVPFVVNQFKSRYQISKTHFLGLGVWGLLQGVEHGNKSIKERMLKWTNNHAGYLESLMRQTFDVYLGGMCAFKQYCPPAVDLFSPSCDAWKKHFGSSSADRCSCCGKQCTTEELQLFADLIDQTDESDSLKSGHMEKMLESRCFDDCDLTVGDFFKSHLRLDIQNTGCVHCAALFQFLFAMFFNCHNDLSYIDLKNPGSKKYDNDELFDDDIVDESVDTP